MKNISETHFLSKIYQLFVSFVEPETKKKSKLDFKLFFCYKTKLVHKTNVYFMETERQS